MMWSGNDLVLISTSHVQPASHCPSVGLAWEKLLC